MVIEWDAKEEELEPPKGYELYQHWQDVSQIDLDKVRDVENDVLEWALYAWCEQVATFVPHWDGMSEVTLPVTETLWLEPVSIPCFETDPELNDLTLRAWPIPVHSTHFGLAVVLRENLMPKPGEPALGLRIQTFCLLSMVKWATSSTVSRIEGMQPWSDPTLYEAAYRIVRKHEAWWKSLPGVDWDSSREKPRGRPKSGIGLFIQRCQLAGKSREEAWHEWHSSQVIPEKEVVFKKDSFRKSWDYHAGRSSTRK
ncbi:MAG: hypothetical protein ACO1SX_23690 [Actinomycetota bacterium]